MGKRRRRPPGPSRQIRSSPIRLVSASAPPTNMTATENRPPRPHDDEYVGGAEMTLVEHLQELRQRIVKSALGIAVGFVIGFAVRAWLLDVLKRPYCGTLHPKGAECGLSIIQIIDPFLVSFKVAAVMAVLIGGPVTCYQIWRFVTPGLRPIERRYALPFIFLSGLLFAMGGALAYFIIPAGLEFLLYFAGRNYNFVISLNGYVDFLLKTMLAFGFAFQFPLAIAMFTLMGMASSETLRRFRRYALFGACAVGAIATPQQDPVSMFAVAIPLVVFYEGNILFARLVERGRRRRASRELALQE
jgi:sec-independent protein translocase protein TatC